MKCKNRTIKREEGTVLLDHNKENRIIGRATDLARYCHKYCDRYEKFFEKCAEELVDALLDNQHK